MRAMLCGCRRHLEAGDEEELFETILAHLRQEHPAVELDEEQIREIVLTHSYRYEYMEVYAGIGPPEEFGPEPY